MTTCTLFHKRIVIISKTHVMELGNYVLGLKFRQSQPQNTLVWELSPRMFWFLWLRLPHNPGYTLMPALLICVLNACAELFPFHVEVHRSTTLPDANILHQSPTLLSLKGAKIA